MTGGRAREQQLLADLRWFETHEAPVFTRRTCEPCQHFQRDRINPDAGVGLCALGLGGFYPNQHHHCAQRRVA